MSQRYRTIIADPPWPFQWSGGKGGRRRRETEIGYDTMTVDEIAGMEEPHLFAHPGGCNLFMWATDEMYREGYAVRVVRAWGFEPCGPPIIWAKDNFGVGVFPRAGHEPLMICRTRGVKAFWNPVPQSNSTHSVQHWSQPRLGKNGGKQHSRKPEDAADLAEIVSPGPYLEMFARRTRFGWHTWGDEALNTVELTA
jgi:N6-adenosine-specific RNA methylase IME4